MKTKGMLALVLAASLLVLSGCQESDGEINDLREKLKTGEEEILRLQEALQAYESSSDEFVNIVDFAIDLLADIQAGDMQAVSEAVHPEKGLRFTPYFYIDTTEDLVFTAAQVSELIEDEEVYHWGSYDGSGDAIDLTFADYYSNFVYNQDFINADIIGNNQAIGSGNSLDNIAEAYPEAAFVEFHFTGFDEAFEGMDWESLRLVFEENQAQWYLVGIVHGQWTI